MENPSDFGISPQTPSAGENWRPPQNWPGSRFWGGNPTPRRGGTQGVPGGSDSGTWGSQGAPWGDLGVPPGRPGGQVWGPARDGGGNFPPIDHFLIRLVPLSAARARKVQIADSFWMTGLPRVFHGGSKFSTFFPAGKVAGWGKSRSKSAFWDEILLGIGGFWLDSGPLGGSRIDPWRGEFGSFFALRGENYHFPQDLGVLREKRVFRRNYTYRPLFRDFRDFFGCGRQKSGSGGIPGVGPGLAGISVLGVVPGRPGGRPWLAIWSRSRL